MRRAGAVALFAILIAVFMTGMLWQRSPGPAALPNAGHGQGAVLLGAPNPTPGQPAEPAGLPYYDAKFEWPLVQLNADQLWARAEGAGIRVAVVSTGIDTGNPDLAGAVITPQGGRQGSQPGTRSTEIAGLIAGRGSSADAGILPGLAPQAQLINIQLASDKGQVDASTVASGIDQAAADGAQVIDVPLVLNLSPDGKLAGKIQEAVTHAVNQGAIVVAPVGPPGQTETTYPAQATGVVAVAAGKGMSMRPTGALAGYGTNAIYAPGNGLYSTRGPAGYAAGLSGNDLATAYVSAAAALLLSAKGNPGVKKIENLLVGYTLAGNPPAAPVSLDPLTIMKELDYPLASSSAVTPTESQSSSSQAAGQQDSSAASTASSPAAAKSPSGKAAPPGPRGLSWFDKVLIGACSVLLLLVVWQAVIYRRRRRGPPGPGSGSGLIDSFPIDWDLEPQ